MIHAFVVTIVVSRGDWGLLGVSAAVPHLPHTCGNKPGCVKARLGTRCFQGTSPRLNQSKTCCGAAYSPCPPIDPQKPPTYPPTGSSSGSPSALTSPPLLAITSEPKSILQSSVL